MTSKAYANAVDASAQQGGRRNLIINGAMQVAQRGTSFTFSNGNTPFVVDRFQASENGTPSFVFTVSQDTDAPSNFKQSVKFDCTTAEPSLAVGARATLRHRVEAQDLQSLAYGTADAQDITFSFWVKTNVTGTYTVWFYNEDGNRQTTNTFSISTQDTWERKTVLISADTVGSINNDNGTGLQIEITLAAGTNYTTGTALNGEWETGTTTANRSVGQTANLASSTSNYINITGVQLEVGSVATPFEHISYGESLAACQRYYEVIGNGADDTFASIGSAFYYTSSSMLFPLRFAVTKRTKTYTLDATSGATYYSGYRAGGMDDFNSFSITRRRPQCCTLYNDTEISGTQGDGFEITLNSGSAFVAIDDEL